MIKIKGIIVSCTGECQQEDKLMMKVVSCNFQEVMCDLLAVYLCA